MADANVWDYVGPAVQAGAGVVGALGGASAAAGGYNNAAGTIQGGVNTSGAVLSPYSSTGSAAESTLANLYGIGGQAPDFSAFTNSPGYQFQKQQGDQAIQRAANATGGGFSSTTLAQLGNYNSGLAASQYQQYLQGLYGLTQTGAGAASAQGSQAITGATAQGNAQVGAGQSNASGIAGAAGSLANLAGKLPWQQIGGANGSSGDPSIGTYAGNVSNDAVNEINNWQVQPITPDTANSSGVTSLYGDASNP